MSRAKNLGIFSCCSKVKVNCTGDEDSLLLQSCTCCFLHQVWKLQLILLNSPLQNHLSIIMLFISFHFLSVVCCSYTAKGCPSSVAYVMF